jgi:hypothetical protein
MTERMVDVYDFGTSADQPRNDPEMHLHHMEYMERTLPKGFRQPGTERGSTDINDQTRRHTLVDRSTPAKQ